MPTSGRRADANAEGPSEVASQVRTVECRGEPSNRCGCRPGVREATVGYAPVRAGRVTFWNRSIDSENLRELLRTIPPGPIVDTKELESGLAKCWHQLEGSDAESMEGSKLRARMEDVVWQPPVLTFRIERHGGTVQGSSRADLHEWIVDVEAGTAKMLNAGHRQLKPANPPLKVGPLATRVASAIVGRQLDECLQWRPDGTVQVKINLVIPDDSVLPETTRKRRKRFRSALEGELSAAGWVTVRPNVYRPQAVSAESKADA